MCSYFRTVAEQEVDKTALLLLQFQRTGEPWMSDKLLEVCHGPNWNTSLVKLLMGSDTTKLHSNIARASW